MANLNIALLLMVVGLATVLAILLIVIYLSKGLVAFVNKYVPAEELPAKAVGRPVPIPANIRAVIDAAVKVVTHGKGKAANIEKL